MSRLMKLGMVVGMVTALAGPAAAGDPTADEKAGKSAESGRSAWEALKLLAGTWEGTGKGDPGESRVQRRYELVLKDKFLSVQNTSTFDPQEKNPKGEKHEDRGMFSYDTARNLVVFRQFHGEGFVNQYVLDEFSADGKKMVFTTEAVENGPPGLRARIIYTIVGDDELNESFELAFGGKDFSPCVTNRLHRKR